MNNGYKIETQISLFGCLVFCRCAPVLAQTSGSTKGLPICGSLVALDDSRWLVTPFLSLLQAGEEDICLVRVHQLCTYPSQSTRSVCISTFIFAYLLYFNDKSTGRIRPKGQRL